MNIFLSIKNWFNAGGNRRKWTVGLIAASAVITAYLMLSGGSSQQSSSGVLEPTPLYFAGVIIKLIGVLLLIIGGAIFLRRWQVKSGIGPKGRSLNVVETVRLSPKQAIHLVRVGNQYLLIGATDQTISMLSAVEKDQLIVNENQKQDEPALAPVNFSQVLQSLAAGQPPSSHGSDKGTN